MSETMRRLRLLGIIPATMLSMLLLVRFRRKAVARFNRVVTNRITRRFAGRAPGFGIVIHRGRRSGRVYRTPVNLFQMPGGFVIALTYGRESEWVRNVLAANGAELETSGRLYRLFAPAIVDEPEGRFPKIVRLITRIGGVTDFFRVSASETGPAPAAEPAAASRRG